MVLDEMRETAKAVDRLGIGVLRINRMNGARPPGQLDPRSRIQLSRLGLVVRASCLACREGISESARLEHAVSGFVSGLGEVVP